MPDNSDIFNQVRNSVDIVDVIAEHLSLKRAGKESKALCPFHDDHKPSMCVVPQKQIFWCPVCNTAGDVFAFVKNFHKMTAGEALKYLAQKGGVTLPELPRAGARSSTGESSIREQIITANDKATSFFEKFLRTPEGKPGLDYLHSRGLTDETIKRFRLGYSPDNWTGLCTAAGRLNLTNDHLVAAGLAKKRQDGSLYDAFRGRVIFPILDATDRVIALGGRILVEKRDEAGNVVEAKYLNSPETPAFNKSASLYGLPLAKSAIIKSQTAIIVEGYMDVIACHQSGVSNVVATLGTALTPEHAKILRRFCQTVTLVFDSDDAGFRAADRAMETFVKEPLDVKIASVPDGKDPCDFCISRGPAGGPAFEKLVAQAADAMTFQWDRLKRQFNATNSLSNRQQATTQYMRFVAQAMEGGGGRDIDPIRRGLLISKISDLVGLTASEVQTILKSQASSLAPRFTTPNASAGSNTSTPRVSAGSNIGTPSASAGSNISTPSVSAGSNISTPSVSAGSNISTPSVSEPRISTPSVSEIVNSQSLRGKAKAESWVLGALLTQPALYPTIKEDLYIDMFTTFTPLAEKLMEYLESASDFESCTLADFVSAINDSQLAGQAIALQLLAEAGGKCDLLLTDGLRALQLTHTAPPPEENPTSEAQRQLELARLAHSRNQVRQVLPPKQPR